MIKHGKCTLHFYTLLFLALAFNVTLLGEQISVELVKMDKTPKYLFKIITLENWNESQSRDQVKLSNEDDEFIHLSKQDQLDRIVQKYWSEATEYVLIKIDTSLLTGKLVYEANPGGTNKYYHLYNGTIPRRSIVEVNLVHKKK